MRHHGGRQRRRIDLQAFDRAQHRDRRRDRAVAVEQRGADQADDQKLRAPGARLARCARDSSASSATMPPSPRLSARRIRSAYLIEMIRISAHRISDTTPRTASGVSGPPGRRPWPLPSAHRGGWCRCRRRRRRARRASRLSGGGWDGRRLSTGVLVTGDPQKSPKGHSDGIAPVGSSRARSTCQSATRRRKLPWGLLSGRGKSLWGAVGGDQPGFKDRRL